MAKTSSVVAGLSETTRLAGWARRVVSPASSTTTRAPLGCAGRDPQAVRRARSRLVSVHQRNRPSPTPGRWAIKSLLEASVATGPSPEGVGGGTSREVSWLRASARLPGFPVARERRNGARYSGGAAPVSHRLPSIPTRVESIVTTEAKLGGRTGTRKLFAQCLFETSPLGLILLPFLRRDRSLFAGIARIELRQLIQGGFRYHRGPATKDPGRDQRQRQSHRADQCREHPGPQARAGKIDLDPAPRRCGTGPLPEAASFDLLAIRL